MLFRKHLKDTWMASIQPSFHNHHQAPTTHSYRSHGSGLCIFSDMPVTAEVLLSEGKVARVLILDLAVHQVWKCNRCG